MALPTRADLYAEIDRRFAVHHPEAPARLDPDDPAQAHLVHEWTALRDALIVEWTDACFAGFFPTAGRLDPADPADGPLIEYWRDIHEQIASGQEGRWDWTQMQPEPLAVTGAERDAQHGGFTVTFSREVELDEAGTWLFDGPLPVCTTIERRMPNSIGVRLGIDGLRQMRDEVALLLVDAGVLSAD